MSDDLDETGEPKTTEVIRIGVGNSRIIGITQRQISYVGRAGEPCTIDLKECARTWPRFRSDHGAEFITVTDSTSAEIDDWNARCVGSRGALDDPPWVQFMNQRHTRFEFEDNEAIYRELLTPMSRYGWHTFDTD